MARPASVLVLFAAIAASALTGTVAVAPARAASDRLKEAVSTTYRVDPAKSVVHVTLDITATSLEPNTATRVFFYNTLTFAVQTDARSFAATSNGLGTQPDTGYEAGRRAFANGDATGASAGAKATLDVLAGAAEIGRQRATMAGIAIAVVVLLLALVVLWLIRRRRRHRRARLEVAAATTPDPYATLAATPDPVDPVEAGDAGAGGVEPNRWG